MALPPTIPTSFVPYSASAQSRRFRADYSGAFAFLGYGVFVIAIGLSIGVFLYGRILVATQTSKDAQLATAEAGVDQATVESFLELHNRLSSGQTLLANHPAFSGFFTLLQSLMPSTTRFTSLHTVLDDSGVATVQGAGLAKSFNALAAASTAFATDGRIKNAIFSNIIVNKDNSVSFSLAATLDPSIIAFSPASAPAAPAATTTTP
jgi:hypothetical protein